MSAIRSRPSADVLCTPSTSPPAVITGVAAQPAAADASPDVAWLQAEQQRLTARVDALEALVRRMAAELGVDPN